MGNPRPLHPLPQSNLRKQFYGDLVDLRGALLNTMSVAPHRASSLHVKMHLIDSALHMLEVGAERPPGARRRPHSSCRLAAMGWNMNHGLPHGCSLQLLPWLPAASAVSGHLASTGIRRCMSETHGVPS